jgi:peptide subunit release factor RF-3
LRLLFVIKSDRSGADLDRVLDEISKQLGGKPLPLAFPNGTAETLKGVAGAATGKDIRRELRRAAKRAGLAQAPTPLGVRHLFETLCEEARLASGVIRHLMGHRPKRGDSLPKYYHARLAALREQVAILDDRRKPLINTLSRRAAELARRR